MELRNRVDRLRIVRFRIAIFPIPNPQSNHMSSKSKSASNVAKAEYVRGDLPGSTGEDRPALYPAMIQI